MRLSALAVYPALLITAWTIWSPPRLALWLALAWVLTDPGVTSAVVGPRSPEHLKPMVAAVDLNLTADQRTELATVSNPDA